MRIRQATAEDLPRLIEMAQRFIERRAYEPFFTADVPAFERLAAWLFEQGAVLVIEHPGSWCVRPRIVGMLAVGVVEHALMAGAYAEGLAFWVDPEHRASDAAYQLLRSAEEWARLKGCFVLKVGAPAGSPRLGTFYEQLGYLSIETVYQKTLR